MKRLWVVTTLVVALLAVAGGSTPAAAAPGYVSRAGTTLVDPAGRPLKLNGVNLGGQLMWEGWIIGAGMQAETPLYDNLVALAGAQLAAAFRADMRAGFVTLSDFQAMKAMGINCVRIPFNHRVLANDGDGGFATLDRLISYAEQTGIYVVLDMHGVPGGQSAGFIADPGPGTWVWYDTAAQAQTAALWRRIAQRYAGRSVIAGYDLINEPDAPVSKLLGLYHRIIGSIREVDPNHMVIVEGNSYARDFTDFTRQDDNLAFSFHLYPFNTENADADLAKWISAAEAADVPLWNGEWGESGYADVERDAARFAARPELDGQTMWTWKKADRNRFWGFPTPTNPSPVKFKVSDAWFKVAHAISQPADAPVPTAEETEAGLRSFVSAIDFGAGTTDSRLASVLRGLSGGASDALVATNPVPAPVSAPAPVAAPAATPATTPARATTTAPVMPVKGAPAKAKKAAPCGRPRGSSKKAKARRAACRRRVAATKARRARAAARRRAAAGRR